VERQCGLGSVLVALGISTKFCLTRLDRLEPSCPAEGMDVVKAVQGYITKIVNGTTGIKVLLLDSHTVDSFSAQTNNRPPSYPSQQLNQLS
jgi:hypothetical protein